MMYSDIHTDMSRTVSVHYTETVYSQLLYSALIGLRKTLSVSRALFRDSCTANYLKVHYSTKKDTDCKVH